MTYLTTNIMDATEGQGLKVLVHGPAGVGKTVLAATTGAPERTVIISAEGGLLSLRRLVQEYPDAGIDQVTVWVPRDVNDLAQMYRDLAAGGHGFEWVCIDSVSEVAEQILAEAKERLKDGRQIYGDLNERMMDLLRKFRDLPMNVYMSCKQEREKDELSGRTLYMPSMPGRRLTQGIAYLFDEVFALRVETDDNGPYRVLQCQPDGRYEAKDRSGRLEALEAPHLGKVHSKIMGGGQ